jgi:hypothetical protein
MKEEHEGRMTRVTNVILRCWATAPAGGALDAIALDVMLRKQFVYEVDRSEKKGPGFKAACTGGKSLVMKE